MLRLTHFMPSYVQTDTFCPPYAQTGRLYLPLCSDWHALPPLRSDWHTLPPLCSDWHTLPPLCSDWHALPPSLLCSDWHTMRHLMFRLTRFTPLFMFRLTRFTPSLRHVKLIHYHETSKRSERKELLLFLRPLNGLRWQFEMGFLFIYYLFITI